MDSERTGAFSMPPNVSLNVFSKPLKALGSKGREAYFGADGVRNLRGIRNRLSHNYLEIDHDILWDTVNADLPLVHQRIAVDVATAREIVSVALKDAEGDENEWRARHLRPTRDS